MPLTRIKQTSKTMIIEEFCTSEKTPDLYTMLKNEDVKQKSEFFSLIEKNLEVRSFEEFVEKFMPSVWEWYETSDSQDCPARFCFSLEKPAGAVQAHELNIADNEFYKMVMDLYSKKTASGESNLEFDYSRVAELLSPGRVLEHAKQLRKDLMYNYNKMTALGEGAKSERNQCVRRIKEIRKEIVGQYKDSFTGRIKLALADTENKLAALPDRPEGTEKAGGQNQEPLGLPCRIQFDDSGDLEVIPIEINHVVAEDGLPMKEKNEIAALVAQDFDKYGDDTSPYIKNLVVENYSGCDSAVQVLNREELTRKHDQYLTIYKNSQEQFIRAISSAVEKILNVKVFFEQASVAGRKLPAPVIITNCKADRLVEEEGVKKSFRYLVGEMGKEVDSYRVWFAVIPAVGDEMLLDNPDLESDYDDDLDLESFDENERKVRTTDGESLVSMQTVNQMMEILKAGKITAFFNYRANEKTGFARFNSDILDLYRSRVRGGGIEGNEYAIFTYPNFTILPKKETAIEIGRIWDGYRERKEYLDIPGIYVDSSYVAAGLVAASQNPDYLAHKKYKVEKNNPCVRFDLEEGDNRFIMLTNMNREGKGSWSSEVEDNIGKDMFGFCFCGNTKFYKDARVNHTYVYIARNMSRDKDGVYKPIYTRLTKDFIMQYLQTDNVSIGGGDRVKKSTIDKFIEEKVGRWKREAESNKCANDILKENEDVYVEDNKLRVRFKKESELIQLDIEED